MSVTGTSLGALRQVLSARVGSKVVVPFVVARIPPLLTLVATELVVMISGMTGVVTTVGVKLDENGSCPTITPL